MTADTIAILDDEPDRLDAMVPILRKRYPSLNVVTFDNAPDINAWFAENLQSCVLICLDHDLGPNRKRDGAVFDPGIGRDVADYLASRDPVCPIIIHTTNTDARPGMIFALEDGGWVVSYVSPYSDVLWVREVWADEVGDVLSQFGGPTTWFLRQASGTPLSFVQASLWQQNRWQFKLEWHRNGGVVKTFRQATLPMSGSDRILTELRRIIAERDHAGPASDDVIAAAESELGLIFPPSYRVFLTHFGAGGIPAPYAIIGLPQCRASDSSPPMWSHVVDVAIRLRRHADHPPTLIPISSDGCGVNIYLDVSRTDDTGECPVLARGPGFDDIDIAPSFLAFAELAVSGDPLAQT